MRHSPLRALLATAVLAAPAVAVEAARARPAAAAPSSITIRGRGHGHGLGLSQWGARGFAANGWSADRILTHYYSGTTVSVAATPSELRVGQTWQRAVALTPSRAGTARCSAGGSAAIAAQPLTWRGDSPSAGTLLSGGTPVLSCAGQVLIDLAATPVRLTTSLQGTHLMGLGTLELSPEGAGTGRAVIVFSGADAIEQYLQGLGEVSSSWPAAAIEAQTVAARTHAVELVNRLGQHRRGTYPCDCAVINGWDQAYGGLDVTAPSRTAAVQRTQARLVLSGGRAIQAFYSASSGGHTENNELQWGGSPISYLRGVDDPYDASGGNPDASWTVQLSWTELERRLNSRSSTAVGTLQSVEIVKPLGVSGRATVVRNAAGGVRIVGTGGTKQVAGTTFQSALGLKSNLFSFDGPPVPPEVDAYVAHAYRDFLGREPDPGGRASWGQALTDGLPRASFIRSLAGGPEWAGRVIDEDYQAALGRPADPEGKAYWLDQLARGRTAVDVAASVFGSPELYATQGGTPEGWVRRLYTVVAGRSADSGGLAYWSGEVRRGVPLPAIAATFLQAPENRGRRVDDLYHRLLHRDPDPAGRSYWVGRLANGDDLALAAQLASSQEYYAAS